MFEYNFYLIYDTEQFEKLEKFGEVDLAFSNLVAKELLTIRRETEISEAEMRELINFVEELVEKNELVDENSKIVCEELKV